MIVVNNLQKLRLLLNNLRIANLLLYLKKCINAYQSISLISLKQQYFQQL